MKKQYLTTALALIASPALADITPEELWQSWQETNGLFGMSLSAGTQSREGAVLVLQNISATMDFGFFLAEQSIAEMRLEALGDGTVSVNYDSAMSGTVTFTMADIPSQSVTIAGQFEGTQGVVSGTAEDYVYDFSIGRMQMQGTAAMSVENSTQTKTSTNSITTGLSGRMHVITSDAGMNLDYSFSLDEAKSTQDSTNSIGGDEGGFKQSQRSLASGYTGEITLFMPTPNAGSPSGSFIPEGFTLDAQLGIAHMNIIQKTASPYFNMDLEMDQQAMGISLTVNEQNIGLATSGAQTFVTVAMPQLGPQPYRTDFANTALALSLPYRPSDSPQNASFALSLSEVTLSESLWTIADPESTLSRAPADFAISAIFNSTLLLDWTNFETTWAWDGARTLLHKITLETFLVGFENARLEGEGAVDFSNQTGVPEPNGGALSFTLTGIPALLEKLGGLPLVDPAITAQANGVLGIFTSAGEGDTLVSEIEFGEGGSILVNGLQVK